MSTSHSYVNDQFTLTVLTAWSIFSLLLTTVLSTGIVSSLILPMYSSRVDTLKQLVEGGYYWTAQYYIEFVSEDLKASIFDFQNKRHKLYEKRYKYMTENAVSAAMYTDKKMTMISQVLNNDLVVLDTDGTVGHEALKLYRVARESLGRGHISFGVEKHSPMLEPLTIMTMRFMEAGLLREWKFQVLYRWPLFNTRHLLIENDVPTFGQPEVMPISKLRPLFYMLTAGLMFAFIIFCLEILWYNG
ncbi:uncharacterized protein LOC129004476 [Macrosteles quadrilineatus]|uniref:uncharacterized protein LOC129004476 n=1 Tax=Macrosteles quadrilineatus TaxID=74068 RepID=UPI0023E211B9|nr:uncharacterized protein LOC129004476 [Macrosteles quadrilineatus]